MSESGARWLEEAGGPRSGRLCFPGSPRCGGSPVSQLGVLSPCRWGSATGGALFPPPASSRRGRALVGRELRLDSGPVLETSAGCLGPGGRPWAGLTSASSLPAPQTYQRKSEVCPGLMYRASKIRAKATPRSISTSRCPKFPQSQN